MGRTHDLLPKLSLANFPTHTLPAHGQKEPTLQSQIALRLHRRRESQIFASPHTRAVVLELADTVRSSGLGLQGSICEVEDGERVVAWTDEAEEVVCLRVWVEEGGCADVREERGVELLGGRGGCEEVEVGGVCCVVGIVAAWGVGCGQDRSGGEG